MGKVNADINAIEIVEKYEGFVVDDFMVDLPAGAQPDSLVTICTSLPDVEVLWLGYYPEAYGLQGDVELLNRMSADSSQAQQILTEGAPSVLRADWALLLDRESGEVQIQTELAPDLGAEAALAFGSLNEPGILELPDGWLPGWGATLIAKAPMKKPKNAIIVARRGGPEFIASELARLRHLAALARQPL
jgi:hypothetical protein